MPRDETKLEVNYKLTKILNEVIEKAGIDEKRIAYLGLYGSQNYNMDSENSDVDCECFIFPSKEDLTFGHQLFSTCYTTSFGTCHVKDIRMTFNELRKASPNILEVFYSSYALINFEYKYYFEYIYHNLNYYATLNPYRFMRGLEGLLRRYEKDLENPKYFANYLRIRKMITETLNGFNYTDVITPSNAEYLTKLKYSEKIADNDLMIAREAHKNLEEILKKYFTETSPDSDKEVLNSINSCEYDLMEKYFKLTF